VSQEIETSGVSSHILVVEADGMSVLTAWSAGKFSGEVIVKALIDSGVESQISHRILIIPGYIAALSGELEDRLPGWAILVGPQDVADIGSFFKEIWFKQKF
jgi:acetyl-CoA decarbonylase/synthase complex subunit gamma